jgi:hypothetical protein
MEIRPLPWINEDREDILVNLLSVFELDRFGNRRQNRLRCSVLLYEVSLRPSAEISGEQGQGWEKKRPTSLIVCDSTIYQLVLVSPEHLRTFYCFFSSSQIVVQKQETTNSPKWNRFQRHTLWTFGLNYSGSGQEPVLAVLKLWVSYIGGTSRSAERVLAFKNSVSWRQAVWCKRLIPSLYEADTWVTPHYRALTAVRASDGWVVDLSNRKEAREFNKIKLQM